MGEAECGPGRYKLSCFERAGGDCSDRFEGLSILPFGNGAERMLQNKQVDCSIHGLNFNIHNKAHIARAAQEGIVFFQIWHGYHE